jgi:undecaprenyl-diphosphatase
MRPKRPRDTSPSWPEQLPALRLERDLWIARERSVALWMHGAATRAWVVRLLDTVSRVGDGWLWYAIIVCLPIAKGTVGASASARMIAVGIVNLVVYRIVKRWIARPRPYRTCPGIRACGRSLDEFSFPSGHTLHSVAFSLILTVYYPMFALFVWPFTLLVAVSRIVLGLHYPSDVLVGALIGAITAGVSFNLL